MKKVCIALLIIAFMGCSTDDSNNEKDDEWISPRKCFELMPSHCHDFDENGNCISDLVGDPNDDKLANMQHNEEIISTFEQYECVFRKSACINAKGGEEGDKVLLSEENLKCNKQ